MQFLSDTWARDRRAATATQAGAGRDKKDDAAPPRVHEKQHYPHTVPEGCGGPSWSGGRSDQLTTGRKDAFMLIPLIAPCINEY